MDNTDIFTAAIGTYDETTKILTVPNATWPATNASATKGNQIRMQIKVTVNITGAPQQVNPPAARPGVTIGTGRLPHFPRTMKLHAQHGGAGVELIDA
jgi:hypothetical protein